VTGLEVQHFVTGAERVDEDDLPGAGARRRVDHDLTSGPEHRLDVLEDLQTELGELRTTVVDGRRRHGAQRPVLGVGRARDLQKVATGVRHRRSISRRRLLSKNP
jgi:hypothetical protein